MVVAVVHQRQAAVMGSGKGQGELGAADGIGLDADAENLGLDAGLDEILIKGFGEDFLDGFFVADARAHAVGRDILVAVAGPDVHDAGHAGLLGEILGDADAGLAVFNPEASGLFIGAGKGQTVLDLLVREEGGVEVDAEASFFCELDPFGEVLGLQFIAVDKLARFHDGIAGVEV